MKSYLSHLECAWSGETYPADQLMNLSPAAKQLLRTGPDNVRRIQAKIRELAQALGITPLPDGR